MKISFIDFWGGFDVEKNFLTELLKNSMEEISVVKPEECDILICGQFGNKHLNYKPKKKIFNELETFAPPDFSVYDFAFGFDFNDYEKKYIRIPCWMWHIKWFDNTQSESESEKRFPLEFFFEDNPYSTKERKKFSSFVFSNPIPDRISILKKFESYKTIDVFGNLGATLPLGYEIKMNVISDYKFNFCYENTIRPGSFTEKLIHAKLAGCVPIYKSDLSYERDFNKSCCIQVLGMTDDEILERVKELDNNPIEYKKIQSEPLFCERPTLDTIYKEIKRILI